MDPEIDRLNERLSFYESFDQLIQSNVTQAGALLREAIDLRENAAADAANAKHQVETDRTQDRERYRALFSVMLDEITSLQGQAERLARRLTDAVDQLESELGPATEFPPLPSNLTPELKIEGELRDAGDQALLNEELAGSLDDFQAAGSADPAALGPGSEVPGITVDEVVEEPESEPAGQPVQGIDDSMLVEAGDQVKLPQTYEAPQDNKSSADSQDSPPAHGARMVDSSQPDPGLDDAIVDAFDGSATEAPSELDNDRSTPVQPNPYAQQHFVLLVHGVPRAATALALKRHLESLEQVQLVEPREFAAGMLRLQLHVSRDVTADDLQQWPEIAGFTAISSRSGLLEIQLHH
ncbi:hypothetical protein BH24CHL4_BH24CHL4_12200 [soil metagenome]